VNNASAQDQLVSVIISAYKRHDYLAVTLRSILAQTHANLEVLVVADGHDPLIESLVRDLEDPRVGYYFTEHAGFPAVPRNEGLRRATGQLLAFCDDDDLWDATKLEVQIPVLLAGNYGMCTSDFRYVDQDGQALPDEDWHAKYFGEIDWKMLFHSMGFVCNAAVLFSREVYERVGELNEDPQLRAHEDTEYWLRVLHAANGYFIPQQLVSYRVHQGSIQKNSAWRVFQSRVVFHRSLRRTLPITHNDYWRKYAKLWFHLLCDGWSPAKRLLKRMQSRG
jgi:glycosyltransferase involved in cell wall biosynthesis